MKGHLRERSPGRWAIILDCIDPVTGKRRRRWHSFKGTKRSAQIECARLINEKVNGTLMEPNKTTVAQFFDKSLDQIKSQVSPRSHERYAEIAKKNLAPLIGGAILTKLSPIMISGAYSTALTSGRRDGKGGLSSRTVHHMHRVLKQALGQAVSWQMLNRNPADAVDPPKVERTAMQTYTVEQTAALIDSMRGSRFCSCRRCSPRSAASAGLKYRHCGGSR